MRIAVYTKPLHADENTWQQDDRFVFEILKRLFSSHPDHEFFIIYDGRADESPFTSNNLQSITLIPAGSGSLSLYRRVNWTLPGVLKKQKTDVLLSMTGILPMKCPVPSCLVIKDASLAERITGRDVYSRYLKKYLKKYLPTANSLAAVSDFCKQKLISHFKIPGEKISVIHQGIPGNFHPFGWEERELVKNEYTDGCEYLICTCTIHPGNNIINLMKAFSIFKKRLRSNMMLVLTGKLDPGYKDFPELLRTYQFRGDIKMPGHAVTSEMSRLMGAAYALVCPSNSDDLTAVVLEALKCRIPVLAAAGSALEETGGEAAVYFNENDVPDLGNIFCEIYKNENLRARLIASADAQAAKFSWDNTADRLWLCLQQAKK